MRTKLLSALSPLVLLAASCGTSSVGDSKRTPATVNVADEFKVDVLGTFDEPWALARMPDGAMLITEKAGRIKLRRSNGEVVDIAIPVPVDYGGQGGLGDLILSPNFAKDGRFFLSWAAKGPGDTRGAEVGRGTLVLDDGAARIIDFRPFWMQVPKVNGRGHYSHRLSISPDGKYLFIASGDRQKFTPAQDLNGNLGKIVRIETTGEQIPKDNPWSDRGGIAATLWTLGHRNILGLQFDSQSRLWALEHGPAGGDELNLIKPGQNYGWPLVSDGDHYDGRVIPRHATRPDLAAPAISWNPVFAPGDFIFYSGRMWPEWKGQAIIAGMGTGGLVRVRIAGEKAFEQARYPLGKRIRDVLEAPDGSLYVLEDGKDGRLLRLSRK